MATVLNLTPHFLPASEHPSLNLDLSLGSLFSEHHASSETMATAQSGVTDCKIAAASTSRGRSAGDSASPALYVNEPVHLPSPKVLQAQRWHAARKRRKSIIEEKLLKRLNGDNLSLGEAQTQSRLADCTMQGFEWDFFEGRAYDPKVLDVIAVGKMSSETKDACKSAVPLDLEHGMPLGMSHGHKLGMDGDVSSPVQPWTSRGHGKLRLCLPYGESDAPESTLLSHTSCVDSPRDQCVPCGNSPSTRSLYSQSAQYSVTSLPTCASSSSICTGLMLDKRRRLDTPYGEGVDDHDKQKSSNSSSSGLENEYPLKDAQRNMPNEASEAQSSRCHSKDGLAYSLSTPSSSMAYPYPTRPGMPLSYPSGFPLQWGSSLPWFMHYLPHMAVGAMSSMSPSSEKANEATSLPRAHSIPYNVDYHPTPENMVSPSHSFIPAAGTENSSPTACSREKVKNDAAAHLSTAHAGVDVKDPTFLLVEGDNATSNGHLENVFGSDDSKESPQRTVKFSLKADKAMKGKQLQKHVISRGAGAGSSPSSLHKRLDALSKDCGAGGIRHHSQPDAGGRVPKKVKLVRFNSLDNKVIQIKQEHHSHSHHSLNGEWLENDVLAHSCDDDRLEPLHAYLKTGNRPHLHGTFGEHIKKVDRIDAQLDINMCREDKDEEPNNVAYLQNDEERGCGHPDSKEDLHMQSHTSLSEDEQEDESFASLLRVTTRGLGPFGRIIHGAMYITQEKQARLICSCHSKHMSPVEFVQHSGSNDLSHPERSIVLRPLPHVASGLSSS